MFISRIAAARCVEGEAASAQLVVTLMIELLADGRDHPELWSELPDLLVEHPLIPGVLRGRLALDRSASRRPVMQALLAICGAIAGAPERMAENLVPVSAAYPQSMLLRGAMDQVRLRMAARRQ